MRATYCRVKIDLNKSVHSNLAQYRFSDCALKRKILAAIFSLIKKGYRHFVIDIDCLADYWVVEMIYAISNKDKQIAYSIGLTSEEMESQYDWMEDEPLSTAVLLAAYRIYYRKDGWYQRKYSLASFSF